VRATRAVIHLENLRHNIRVVRSEVGMGVRMCMAVKADAYGHGAVPVARAAVEQGVDALGVATVEEGSQLREAGIAAPILLFSPVLPEEYPEVILSALEPMLGSRREIGRLADEAERQGRTARAHLKIDTGMGRIGCSPEEAADLAGRIAGSRELSLAGVCTHFPVADSADSGFTVRQVETLAACVQEMRRRGIDVGLVHAANSGAIIGRSGSRPADSQPTMVRPGIMLYGYYPSSEQERRLPLLPVMEFTSKVLFLKSVPRGTGISYGLTYSAPRDTVIATLPVGYADGYSRLLSNRADVLIGGRRYPIAGRICMDQCMVDLGPKSRVRLLDDVVLFGPDPDGLDAEDIANLMGTIPYEVTCLVSRRVPRLYRG